MFCGGLWEINGLLRQTIECTERRATHVNFMQLIVCLADGQDVDMTYSSEQEDTPLENALECFDKVMAGYEGPGEEVEAVREALKVQAVLACCRESQYSLANRVLQHVWGGRNKPNSQSQETMHTCLESFISSKKINTRFANQHKYESFLKSITSLLQKISMEFNTPFLIRVLQAQRRCEQRRAEEMGSDTESLSCALSIQPSSSKADERPASKASSPIKGFRRSRRLSGEFQSVLLDDDRDDSILSNGCGDTEKSAEEMHPRQDTTELTKSSGDSKGHHGNRKDDGRVGQVAVKRGRHGHETETSDMEEDEDDHHGNRRTDNTSRAKGMKRKLPVVSESEDNSDICLGKDVGTSTTRNGHRRCCKAKSLKGAMERLGQDKTDLGDVVSGRTPSKLTGTPVKRRARQTLELRVNPVLQAIRSSPRLSPSSPPGSLPNGTSTTSHQSRQRDPTPPPSPQQTSSPSPGFVQLLKSPPRRGKSIRNQKYQPNRVAQTGPDVPSTSRGETSAETFSDDGGDSSDSSDSYPILDSPKVRRSLDPETWQGNARLRKGNARLRKAPVRKKKWTWEEEANLKKALWRYGPGRWNDMLAAYDFNGRTNVNLKDKWRNMVKNGEI